jgi:hypothetical protein
MALNASAARHAPHIANPIAPTEGSLMVGVTLFKNDSAGCQGRTIQPTKMRTTSSSTPTRPNSSCSHPTSQITNCSGSSAVGYAVQECSPGGQFAPDANGKDVSDQNRRNFPHPHEFSATRRRRRAAQTKSTN